MQIMPSKLNFITHVTKLQSSESNKTSEPKEANADLSYYETNIHVANLRTDYTQGYLKVLGNSTAEQK
jgi:hypothetical protein